MTGLAQNLSFILLGEDKSASKTMSSAADVAEKATGRIGGAFGKLGGAIGGEFGETLNRVGEGIETVGEKQKHLSTTLTVGGGVATGLGLAMQQMGSANKQATDQLNAAIKATGKPLSDYQDEIDKTIKKQQDLGHSDDDTQTALRNLTAATNDPKKALEQMGLVADLAAARHTDLASASQLVAKIINGTGQRTLTQYGITMEKTGDTTKALASAQDGVTKAQGTLSDATQRLNDLEEIQHGKKKLTISDQIALRNAQEKVTDASANLAAAQDKVTKAQDAARNSGKNVQDALDSLSKKVSGQAESSVDNFAGKVGILTTKLGDWAADMANKVGPVLTAIGPVITAVGVSMQIWNTIQDAVAAKQAAAAAAALVAAAATDVQTGSQVALNLAMDASPVGGVALAITGLAAVVGGALLLGGMAAAQKSTADFTTALQGNNAELDINIKKIATKSLLDSGALKAAEKLGIQGSLLVAAATNQAGAQDALDAKIKDVNVGLDAQQKAMDQSSTVTAAQTRAFNDQWQSLELLQGQVSSTGQTLTDQRAAANLYKEALDGIGISAGISKNELKELQKTIAAIPAGSGVSVSNSGQVTYSDSRNTARHAQGGTVMGPEIALVGERGPELVALPGGSHVYPNGQGPQQKSSGGVHIGQLVMQPNQSINELVQELGWFARWAT